jgi:glycosyltransferase involved in cell wall biosynthesis
MATGERRIRVAINANLTAGATGGVFQMTQALVRALGSLDGPERFLLLASSKDQVDWLEECSGPNQEIVVRGRRNIWGRRVRYHSDSELRTIGEQVRRFARPAVEFTRAFLGRLTPQAPRLPLSDGFVESLGCDVLHFPTQGFAVSAVPTVFNPHDLQHLHYPQFWTPWEVARREIVYRAGCSLSAAVIVGSQWAKEDILLQYGVDSRKVQIIPEGAPTGLKAQPTESEEREVMARHRLPGLYALYPANMWPHKNHLRLLEAMAILRDERSLRVSLVCTGSQEGGAWPQIRECISRLGLERQVWCLGFVPELDIRVIQKSAHCVVQPSLFEASSLPIFDAWNNGVPVGASDATALPEQVADAALLFDPFDACSIANAWAMLWGHPELRRDLQRKGYLRVSRFDWHRSAKAYRAIYRRVARVDLCEEDRDLLEVNWMKQNRTEEERVLNTYPPN